MRTRCYLDQCPVTACATSPVQSTLRPSCIFPLCLVEMFGLSLLGNHLLQWLWLRQAVSLLPLHQEKYKGTCFLPLLEHRFKDGWSVSFRCSLLSKRNKIHSYLVYFSDHQREQYYTARTGLAWDSEESQLKRLFNQKWLHLHFTGDTKNLLLCKLSEITEAWGKKNPEEGNRVIHIFLQWLQRNTDLPLKINSWTYIKRKLSMPVFCAVTDIPLKPE